MTPKFNKCYENNFDRFFGSCLGISNQKVFLCSYVEFFVMFFEKTFFLLTITLVSLSMITRIVCMRTSKVLIHKVSTSWWIQLFIFPCSSHCFLCLYKKLNISPNISVHNFNSSLRVKWLRKCLQAFAKRILRDSAKQENCIDTEKMNKTQRNYHHREIVCW